MSHIFRAGLIFLAVLAANANPNDMPLFKITTKHDQDRVEVKLEKDTTTFAVHSRGGIGEAVIERINEKWPDAVQIRLHLNGLENFQISNGKVKLTASVSSQDGTVRLWQDENESTRLDSQNPCSMKVRLVSHDGKVVEKIPVRDGCFELLLPKAFFEGNPKSITANWIDFYRN